MKKGIVLFIIFCLIACASNSKTTDKTTSDKPFVFSKEIYKKGSDYTLRSHIFTPVNVIGEMRRPGILFFHGGGWDLVGEGMLYKQCMYFSEKGWVAISFEYRLCVKSAITPVECIMDAKSAVRWVKENAERLHIIEDSIIVSGASAGGHLAASTAFVTDINDPEDNMDFSSMPDALVLFYPCVNTVVDDWFIRILRGRIEVEKTSPFHFIRENLPPTIIFHGTKDDIVPYDTITAFAEKMKLFGNTCKLHTYEGLKHFLFYFKYKEMMETSFEFLVELGYEVK